MISAEKNLSPKDYDIIIPMSSKAKVIAVLVALGLLLIAVFSSGIYSNSHEQAENTGVQQADGKPMIVQTNPKDLDQSTILPNQTLEIYFSEPLENVPETRWSVEPQADYKAELSDDRKTLKLIPNTPLNLGQSYTLFIKAETKIEGKKTLDKEYQYHFKTIDFKGA